jgi:hypothetical protein
MAPGDEPGSIFVKAGLAQRGGLLFYRMALKKMKGMAG